ncbi:IS200/IS605 family transposase [Chryseobacterium sp. Hurlbut01]|jgi:REP element-mobilizing transposase RayT|uniref:IS200/IS605 family transposase n=1 Tax=Chryseobacterium sp. Hurlbut01 TaxID=1681828 RepID=UPI00067CB81E|nr:IS200/IS605 family transposase [Chryseobacterium sp. Hurlbut01]KNB61145.1 transposase [Chryseobacterium sp. Hurlbut01]
MPFLKIYVHIVFSTLNRIPFLNSKELRIKVWKHIKENASNKGIFLDMVNGYSDHCHCLISLGSSQNIEKVVKLLKGESSFWINKNQLTKDKFAWQDEYFAVSVSESMIDVVRSYIKNQEKHHQKKTFAEEYQEFIEKYDFKMKVLAKAK